MDKRKIIGAASISISAILWGLDGVVLTPRLHNSKLGFVIFMIHIIPFLFMNLILFKEYKKLKEMTFVDILNLFIVALLGGAVGTIAIVKALFLVHFEHLSVVVLLQKLQPVFGILVASSLLKEKLNGKFIIFAIIAIISGYFLTFGTKLPDFNSNGNVALAAIFSLVAAASFGSATAFGKKALSKFNFVTVTFYRYGFTSLIMLVYILFTKEIVQFTKTTNIEWLIFFIIAFTTGSGAIFLFYFGLKKVKAIVSVICELFFPLSAILFDYLINGATFTPIQWFASITLIAAIMKITTQTNIKRMR